jgi:hypothetical protein
MRDNGAYYRALRHAFTGRPDGAGNAEELASALDHCAPRQLAVRANARSVLSRAGRPFGAGGPVRAIAGRAFGPATFAHPFSAIVAIGRGRARRVIRTTLACFRRDALSRHVGSSSSEAVGVVEFRSSYRSSEQLRRQRRALLGTRDAAADRAAALRSYR